ncbi:MAG: acyltransferase domain-containing protein, partial [Deltaproteobacteria bacterium]|nr:acyltransferase domain-containing protein [Deltaproteobacteria bacterium]
AGQAIYAPSVDGRARALWTALEVAETAADDVQFIEAHATSTVVGDANEYDAISTVYGNGRDPADPIHLGSVKGQIGHLKAAAGMAGLLKTVLAMEHETLPHMPRFNELTPQAEKPSRALKVPTELAPWPLRPEGKRIGAVTTSGFGGVNYHAIIEQGPRYDPPPPRPEVSREVAIVGVSCRVAGADDPEKFWSNATAGVDNFTQVDPVELHWEDHLDAGPDNERITTRVIAKLDDYDFNLLRHKIFPNAVSQISPTQLLGLDLADRVLGAAGFELREPKRIGVSMGSMHDDYFPKIFEPMVIDEWADSLGVCDATREIDSAVLEECMAQVRRVLMELNPPVTEHTLPGWMTNVTAGRMANKLNLHGPNFTVDTACSSGLASLVPAIYQLMFGNVDMMITGGLNQQLSDTFTCGVCALGAVAEDIPRPFDAEGKGFLIGEGGVAFLLKRLDKAKQDGDEIFAVINAVHGSSEADSKSMVAPSFEAVSRAIRNTMERSSVPAEDIAVVDTHGSANLVSDLVEAQAVAAELRPRATGSPVQLTAVKSHIGHIYGGSGAASLLSAILSLRTGQVPGIRNLRTTRPEIEELIDRVQPRHGTEPIAKSGKAAAANSLGLGGANYFAVVTVPEQEGSATASIGPRPGLSAGGFSEHSSMRADDEGVHDVFIGLVEGEEHYDAAIGRALSKSPIPEVITHGNQVNARLAVTFETQDALRTKLGTALKMIEGGHALDPLESQGVFAARVAAAGVEREKLAFCFPGQGTHYITMARHLYDGHEGFRAVVDQVSRMVIEAFDFDLTAHIYGDPEDEEIKQRLGTLVGAQTALFAIETGMAEVMRGLGVVPDVLIGHSFGEISALNAAGVWDLPTAFEVVKARIRAAEQIQQQDGPALGMMSVICAEEQRDAILKLAGDKVVLTNINAPNRFILSGERESVVRAVDLAESFGLDARLLPIGSAFHSKYMEPAREPFRAALEQLPCTPPSVPVLSTITGQYVATEGFDSAYLAEHLSRQLVTPLNLPREIERLYSDGTRHFIEVGPGWSMTKMIAGILGDRPHRAAPTLHPKVGDEETYRRARAFLMALGHLDSAAERKNVPGIFSPDFIAYMEQHEPAVLGLIEEVHKRFVAAVTEEATQDTVSRLVEPSTEPQVASLESAPVKSESGAVVAAVVPAGSSSIWIERVREKLMTTTGYPADMLEDDLDLEADLGVDSVQRAEIWISLTTEHGLDTEVRASGIRTIAQ